MGTKSIESLIRETNTLLKQIDAVLNPIDVSDRINRLLGIVYGNLAQLQQRPVSFDLYSTLRYLGVEIDPRSIRALTDADVVTVQDLHSGLTDSPVGRKVTRIGFWEDVNSDTRYMKYYDGNDLLFTVTFGNAQEVLSETWSMTRT